MGCVPRQRASITVPLISALAALVLLLGGATAALAHSELISSDPDDGASLGSMPSSVTLTFNEDVDPNFAQAFVADEQDVARPVTAEVSGPRVTVPVPPEVRQGAVEVRYRVVSADGHPVAGEIRFTVADAAPTGDTSSTTDAAATSQAPAPAATPSAPAQTPAGQDESASTLWMYVLTGFAALLVVGVGVAIVLMGRRRR